jgi:hypothetical protein
MSELIHASVVLEGTPRTYFFNEQPNGGLAFLGQIDLNDSGADSDELDEIEEEQ